MASDFVAYTKVLRFSSLDTLNEYLEAVQGTIEVWNFRDSILVAIRGFHYNWHYALEELE